MGHSPKNRADTSPTTTPLKYSVILRGVDRVAALAVDQIAAGWASARGRVRASIALPAVGSPHQVAGRGRRPAARPLWLWACKQSS